MLSSSSSSSHQQQLLLSDSAAAAGASASSLADLYRTDREAKFQLYSHDAPVCTPVTAVEDITVTLVTQLSHDRLWMMEHHCRRYPHRMAVAVYSNDTLEEVLQELREMGCHVQQQDSIGNGGEARFGGAMIGDEQPPGVEQQHLADDDPLLSVAVLDAQTHGAWNDYPVNELRNVALSLVQTNYIIYIDVDFWTSQDLYETIVESPDIQEALLRDPRLSLVIPAFSLYRQCTEWADCREKNLPKMPYSLPELFDVIKEEKGGKFDPYNKGGHGSTMYEKWMTQKQGSLVNINCLQSHRYEPFVMIRYCRDLPPFQSSFSGYGKNKVTWMMQAIATGYVLDQVGGAYLVHYPHLDSNSRQLWNEAPPVLQELGKKRNERQFNVRNPKKSDGNLPFEEFKRGQMDRLFVEFRQWVVDTIPPELARVGMCHDAQDDDGNLWITPELKKQNKKNKGKHPSHG